MITTKITFRIVTMSFFDRKELTSLAKMSFDIGLYSDAIDYMKQVIKMATPLSYDERDLIFKSYNCLKEHLLNCRNKLNCTNEHLHRELKAIINLKLEKICEEAEKMTENYWIKRDDNAEAVVHYKHFKSTQRYFKVFVTSENKKEDAKETVGEIEEALKTAKETLSPAHPIRLSIAEHLSKLHGFILGSPDEAVSIAREAYEKGLACQHELSEDLKGKSEKELKYLKKDIELWSKKK